MSVTPNEIVLYGAVNMPETDGSTVGGAVDFTKRIAFYDLSTNSAVDFVSSSFSDTTTQVTVQGRDSTGAVQTVTVTLNGTTVITSASQVFHRLLAGVTSGATNLPKRLERAVWQRRRGRRGGSGAHPHDQRSHRAGRLGQRDRRHAPASQTTVRRRQQRAARDGGAHHRRHRQRPAPPGRGPARHVGHGYGRRQPQLVDGAGRDQHV